MNRAKSRASKTAVFVCHCTCYFRTVNLHCRNIFVSLIFVVSWTNENILTPNFSQFTVHKYHHGYQPKGYSYEYSRAGGNLKQKNIVSLFLNWLNVSSNEFQPGKVAETVSEHQLVSQLDQQYHLHDGLTHCLGDNRMLV